MPQSEEDLLESEQIKKIGIALTDDPFNDNKDTKLYKVRDKSYNISHKLSLISNSEIEIAKLNVKKLQADFENQYPALFGSSPDLIYCHVDLDSFYASVESLDHPEYKLIPLAVGGMNMLTTCNYVARKYGVKAGMPGYLALQICPTLKIVKNNFPKYNYYSERVMSVLAIFDEDVEIYGVDEACLVFDKLKYEKAVAKMNEIGFNITVLNEEVSTKNTNDSISNQVSAAFRNQVNNSIPFKANDVTNVDNKEIYVPIKDTRCIFKNIRKLVDNIRTLVFLSTGLTVSSGISVTRGLSKFACGVNKPNGTFLIDKDFDSHILDLETDKINGIGSATKEMLLKSYNIKFVKDLRNNLHLLYLTLPYKSFTNLFNLSYGLSIFDFSNRNNRAAQSIGMNISFRPSSEFSDICGVLWYLCSQVSTKLIAKSRKCSTITVHYKLSTFSSRTKQKKTNRAMCDPIELFNTCYDLLVASKVISDKKEIPSEIRQLGVSCSALINEDGGLIKLEGAVFDQKICPVCNQISVHLNKFMFESHVNNCLNKKEKEKQKKKQTLDYYIKKKL